MDHEIYDDLLLPHYDFGFRITDLGLGFMAFPLQNSNPTKDCSGNYYRDSLDHISLSFGYHINGG